MATRTCPACGRESPADRARCYNCNASLEREAVKEGPRLSEAPTEKRTRPTVDLWKDNFTPPAAQERVNVEPSAEDSAGSFNRSKLVRGPMAAEAEHLQPPRRAGRGSSGDPSEIAPPKQGPSGATPAARPRPKSGETAALRGGAPPGERNPNLGSGTHQLQQRGKPLSSDAEPGPEGPLLEPRRRTPTGQVGPSPQPEPVAPAAPLPPARPTSDVLDAIQAANSAAKERKPIDKNELASFTGALDFDPGAEAATVPQAEAAAPPAAPRSSLSETTADEGAAAAAQAVTAPRPRSGQFALPEPSGPHMPHYLVTQVLGEPVALSRTQVVRIGRGEDNEVIFPLSQVSRHHAEVRFDTQAGAYVIIDKNSINGTFVNGKAIKRRRLADGDRIGIGPFAIVYRASTGGHRLRAMDETDVIRPGSLAGELADMPIPDVVRFIEALRKTGELVVITPASERGTVLFRDGQAVHAEFKVTLGPQAAVAVFRLKAGSFRFSVKTIELAKATISQPLGTLLAEAAS